MMAFACERRAHLRAVIIFAWCATLPPLTAAQPAIVSHEKNVADPTPKNDAPSNNSATGDSSASDAQTNKSPANTSSANTSSTSTLSAIGAAPNNSSVDNSTASDNSGAATGTATPHGSAAPHSTSALVLKSNNQNLWIGGLKSIAIAALALAAAAGSLFWLRGKFGNHLAIDRNHYAPLLISSRRVGQKTTLLVVQWDQRTYLLAESSGATQLLDSRATTAGNNGSAIS